MSPISKNDLDAISMTIASAMSQGFAQLTAALSQQEPRAVAATVKTYRRTSFLPKGAKMDASALADKDARIVAAFTRRGFKPVVLMDRDDPSKDYNIRPYKGWLEVGRVVRKGQHGIRGLFHLHQTDALPPAKPTKGKAKKPTLVPVA